MGNISHHPSTFAPTPAVMAILNRFNMEELGHAIEVLIALLDIAEGDPDAESGHDVEDDFLLSGDAIEIARRFPRVDFVDEDEAAYVEWHTMRGSQKRGANFTLGHEDDEEDDPAGQCTEDEISTKLRVLREDHGPGCTISDSDQCDVERGERTTEEHFYQGEGSARHEDDDNEPGRVPPQWPLGEGEGFRPRLV